MQQNETIGRQTQYGQIDAIVRLKQRLEDRIDEGAKQLITLNGLLQGLYLAAFAFSDLRLYMYGWRGANFIIALSCLTLSLMCTALYYFPLRHRISGRATSLRDLDRILDQTYQLELTRRINWLQRGQILFVVGLIASAILMITLVALPGPVVSEDIIRVMIITPEPAVGP